MIGWVKDLGTILKETGEDVIDERIPTRGAALSYYVLLSLGPLLVLVIGALEFFLSGEQARSTVVEALRDRIGARAAETASTVLQRIESPELVTPEAIVTLLLLVFGATAVFANIRNSLNEIWDVEPEDQSVGEAVLGYLFTRVRGFVMVVLTGVVLVASFVVTSAAAPLYTAFAPSLPSSSWLVRGVDAAISLLLIGLLFAGIFRMLPAVAVDWGTIFVGGFTTAFLFVIGKSLAAWLIAGASWTSYFGPGASIVAFVAWVYLSAQIFYVGAVFAQVWSRRTGGVLAGEVEPNPL